MWAAWLMWRPGAGDVVMWVLAGSHRDQALIDVHRNGFEGWDAGQFGDWKEGSV